MIKKKMSWGNDMYEIEIGSWCRVFKNKKALATVISEEEARRVIWKDIDDEENMPFVQDDLFEEVE